MDLGLFFAIGWPIFLGFYLTSRVFRYLIGIPIASLFCYVLNKFVFEDEEITWDEIKLIAWNASERP